MDVLDCLANLSNDEVFTSPAVVNRMLDTLPEALWSNPNAKFLDPVTKSGVFLSLTLRSALTIYWGSNFTVLLLPNLRHLWRGVPFIAVKILPS